MQQLFACSFALLFLCAVLAVFCEALDQSITYQLFDLLVPWKQTRPLDRLSLSLLLNSWTLLGAFVGIYAALVFLTPRPLRPGPDYGQRFWLLSLVNFSTSYFNLFVIIIISS